MSTCHCSVFISIILSYSSYNSYYVSEPQCCSVIDMTVFTASWSGLSCHHSQLLLYVCSLVFSQLMQDKLGETALITSSGRGHLETVKLFLHRGASINFQRKVRVLYRIAGKFGRELKFKLVVWWSAFTTDK